MKRIIHLLFCLVLAVNCSAQAQTAVQKCPVTHKHTHNYYLENKDGRRIYFYRDTLALAFDTLLKKKLITYKELFVALDLKKRKHNRLPYCNTERIDYTHKDVIGIYGISINDATFDQHHKYAVLLEIATKLETFSVVCIPVKRNKPLKDLRKSDLIGRARGCQVDL